MAEKKRGRAVNSFLGGLAAAFSIYSRIPMPQLAWEEDTMRWALAWFPAVGAVAALLLWGVFGLFRRFAMSAVFFAACAVLVPVAVTGGIHLDGFCDTCDALASHADGGTRLRILKDPHVGAFGVIDTCALLLFQFGAWHQLFEKPAFLLPALAAQVYSRAFAALAVLCFPKAKGSGLAATFSAAAAKGPVTVLLAAAAAAAALLPALGRPPALLAPAASLALLGALYAMTKKRFGGITGDHAGFYVVICETVSLALCALLGAAA